MRQIYDSRPRVTIDANTYAMVQYATQKVASEVAGWMEVEQNEDGYHIKGDLHIPKQDVGSTHADVHQDDMCLMVDKHDNLYCWWHSHVNMGTSPSNIDFDHIETFSEGNPFYIMWITNKKGEYDLEVWDTEENIIWDDVKIEVLPVGCDELDERLKTNLTKKVYTTYNKKWTPPAQNIVWDEEDEEDVEEIMDTYKITRTEAEQWLGMY